MFVEILMLLIFFFPGVLIEFYLGLLGYKSEVGSYSRVLIFSMITLFIRLLITAVSNKYVEITYIFSSIDMFIIYIGFAFFMSIILCGSYIFLLFILTKFHKEVE